MLFVISAPSGAGKTTIIKELFRVLQDLSFSVSATTRKKRENETAGKDYHFLTVEEFNRKKENNEFIETEEVHGHFYGTLKSEIEPFLKSGDHLIFDVDVKGALSIKKFYPDAVLIYIDVPVDELIRRLKARKTESEEEIRKRTSRIMMEAGEKTKFDNIVDNSKGVDEAVNEVKQIILSHSK
jgi:guanylate kinase